MLIVFFEVRLTVTVVELVNRSTGRATWRDDGIRPEKKPYRDVYKTIYYIIYISISNFKFKPCCHDVQ